MGDVCDALADRRQDLKFDEFAIHRSLDWRMTFRVPRFDMGHIDESPYLVPPGAMDHRYPWRRESILRDLGLRSGAVCALDHP